VVRVAEVGVDGWVVKMCVVLLLHFILTWIFFLGSIMATMELESIAPLIMDRIHQIIIFIPSMTASADIPICGWVCTSFVLSRSLFFFSPTCLSNRTAITYHLDTLICLRPGFCRSGQFSRSNRHLSPSQFWDK
jgi:hypothetical protein